MGKVRCETMHRKADPGECTELGDFCILRDATARYGAGFWLRSPDDLDGGTELLRWPLYPDATRKGHSWVLSGSEYAPTLEPSLNHEVGGMTVWHGWVRVGQLIDA